MERPKRSCPPDRTARGMLLPTQNLMMVETSETFVARMRARGSLLAYLRFQTDFKASKYGEARV